MTSLRDVRRCALQVMYQFDAGNTSRDEVRSSLEGSRGDGVVHDEGLALAERAWDTHEEADRTVAELTPDWPTYRQPVVDRNILRLAYYEMTSGGTPPKVAINEAIELAKEFSTERSPMFINGVLDKLFRLLREQGTIADTQPTERAEP